MAKKTIQGIKYLLDTSKRTAEVIANNYNGNICIPPTVVDNNIQYNVTSIGDYAFHLCKALTSITIPNSVTSIGNGAFSNCGALTSVTIGNIVTSIGERAFYDCDALTSITIPNSVTSIGNGAFSDCGSLTSVTIGNSVTSIGDDAFYGCSSLTSVTIPNRVKSIGSSSFSSCSSITSIVVGSGNTIYDSRNNCNAIIETATNTLIAGCQNTVIPNSVTSIGSSAFSGCSSLTSITIPNSVTNIRQSAFRGCTSLTSITIPHSVTNIGYWAFAHCDQLIDVQIGHNFTGIGDVFDGDGRPTQNGKNFGRPLKETERKKRNEPIILAIELFLNALNSGNKKPHDYEYLLGQTIRQYEPAENHQHVSIAAWNHWQNQASTDEDIRQFQYTWIFKDTNNIPTQFNKEFIQEHTTPVADIKKDLELLRQNNNICFQFIEDILEKMHISRILKTEDKAIQKNSGRGLDFEDIANRPDCYQGAGIEFQCSEDKIGYEAFKGCDKLQAITIGTTNPISIPYPKIDKLIKGEKITI